VSGKTLMWLIALGAVLLVLFISFLVFCEAM
jgi:hypothetical protein